MPFLTDPAYRKRTNRRNPWQVIWYEVDGARKVRRFRAGFVTRTQAARWWADFREQYEAGELRHDPTTLGDFITRYREWSTTTQRPSSATLELRTLTLFQVHAGPATRLDAITAGHVEIYLAARVKDGAPHLQAGAEKIRDTGITASTANRELMYLRKLFNVAVRWGELATNPTVVIPKRRVAEKPVVYLEPAEQRKLVTLARRHSTRAHSSGNTAAHLYPLVVLAIRCGLRRSELINLRWSDIHFDQRVLHVSNSPTHRTKSGRQRVVGLDKDTLTALRWWQDWFRRETALYEARAQSDNDVTRRNAEHRLATLAVCTPTPDGFVFPSFRVAALSGKHDRMIDVKTSFNALAKGALPGKHVTIHHLRHTFAVNCARAGVPLPLLAQIMGHADIATTQVYLRFARDAGARSVLELVPPLCAHSVPKRKKHTKKTTEAEP